MAEIFSGLASMPRSDTFFRIEFDVICPKFHKGSFEVDDKMVNLFGLNYDVIDVGLNCLPDEVLEAVEHTALVSCPAFFRPNSIEM